MLVRYGGGILDARGSIGGQTHSRNRSGAYVRARTVPTNPNTPRQAAVRAIMSVVTANWNNLLSAAQRISWDLFALNVPAKNKLGETINLTGFNQYVKSNIASLNASLPAILAGPTDFTLPGEDATMSVVGSEGSQELEVTFDALRDWVNEDGAGMIVQMGAPQDASINYFSGPWRFADSIDGDGTTAPTSPATIVVPFAITENQKLFVRARILRADGRLSGWFQLDVICGA